MAQITSISNGEAMSSVRTKLNDVITNVNLLDPTGWVDYSATSTIVGWSSFTAKIIRYNVIGKMVFVNVNLHGTSNSAATTFTLPFQNKNIQSTNMAYAANNGATIIGAIYVEANNSTFTCYQNFSSAWTATGTKYIYGQFFYEIA